MGGTVVSATEYRPSFDEVFAELVGSERGEGLADGRTVPRAA
jgi:hypothetical protein